MMHAGRIRRNGGIETGQGREKWWHRQDKVDGIVFRERTR